MLGAILTYAIHAGIIEHIVAHGVRKPKDRVRDRRLTENEYCTLGGMLREAQKNDKYSITVEIIRLLALCARPETSWVG